MMGARPSGLASQRWTGVSVKERRGDVALVGRAVATTGAICLYPFRPSG
jgi:hypothetical protein